MLIDESNMAVDISDSFLNCRKQHSNQEPSFQDSKQKQILPEHNRSAKTFSDRPIQIAHYGYTSQTQIHILRKLPTKLISRTLELLESWKYWNIKMNKIERLAYLYGISSRISQKNRWYGTIENTSLQ